jgi:hypothetical protein
LESERDGSLLIVALHPVSVVAVTVKLDHQALARAIEIRDVSSERLLAGELVRQVAEELVPQLLFCRGRIAA